MPNPFAVNGGQPQKQPKYTPIFVDRAFTGLYTQRAVLHDPSDIYTSRYYGGRPDALLGGRNIELTNRLTLQRRPGMVPFRTSPGEGASYATAPDRAFSFQLDDGTIRVIIDTQDSGLLAITSVANSSGSTAVYTGTFPGGGSNGYAGMIFTVAGFVTNAEDNGVFTCTASTTTTLTLSNSVAVAETIAATAETAGAVYWDKQDGTATMIYAKTAGAGQMYFISVAGVLYMGDGQDTKKYTPLNLNGTIWNWGIVAPTVQPGVTSQSTGAAATVWQKNTNYTTMGLTEDTNATPQIWQLIGVNDDGTNPGGQYGTAGVGEPNWNTALWGQTPDGGSLIWINAGLLDDWMPNTFYTDLGTNPTNHGATGAIGVQSVNCIYGNYRNFGFLGKTEGPSTEPKFSGAHPGANYQVDNHSGNSGTNWYPLFNWTAGSAPLRWKQGHTYAAWYTGSPTGSANQISGAVPAGCCITGNLPSTPTNPVYLMIPLAGGTSSSGYQPFPASASFGQIAHDGQLTWQCLGQAARQNNHPYVAWTAPGAAFSCIYDGTNFQVATVVTGNSAGSAPSWSTGYGSPTTDGGVTWTNVGPNVAWAAGSGTTGIWHLPLNGFAPPSPSQKFGGSEVDPTNGNLYVQAVISSGKSGSGSEPTWVNPNTNDGSIIWQQAGLITANSLPNITYGLCYAYSYKAMPVDDFYAPLPLGGGNTPPGGTAFLSVLGSQTNAISSSSPPNQFTGAATGTVNTVTGRYSADPQVNAIVIWRSADSASGSDNMFELTEIPNIPSLANTGPTYDWQFQDYLPSVATGVFPGLNVLLPAPTNGVNDPPLSTYLPQVYNYQRIWGSNDQSVNFSGGPDTNVGNPNEAFLISDELPFLAPVTRLVRTPQGIVTFLTDSIEFIGGGPATATFFSTTMAPGIGLLSYNACDVFAGEIYFFASDNTFRAITPGLNLTQFGFPLGDQFANNPSFGSLDTTWDPSKVYVAVHQNGTDNCIFVADGSTGWYRLNPHQVPGAAQGPEPIWSPFAVITGGMKMVQSVETTPGIKQLLAGGTAPGDNILVRSLTNFQDDGVSYDAYFTMGSISLAQPGTLALLKFLEFDFSGVGFQPTVSYLLNEISGTFTSFVNGSGVPQFDPPSLYGNTISPTSYSPNRYYFGANPALARCRHLQIKVDYGTNANGNEMYSMTIYGRYIVEE